MQNDNTTFMQLIKASEDAELAKEMKANGYDTLLEHYIIAEDDLNGFVCADSNELGDMHTVCVDIVIVLGLAGGGMRCFKGQTRAYKDAEGNLWFDEADEEDVFM